MNLGDMPDAVSDTSRLIASAWMSTATMQTSEGPIELELFDGDAPTTVSNFTKLAGEGYYDGLTFHRVIPDFMVNDYVAAYEATIAAGRGGK